MSDLAPWQRALIGSAWCSREKAEECAHRCAERWAALDAVTRVVSAARCVDNNVFGCECNDLSCMLCSLGLALDYLDAFGSESDE